MAPCHRKRGRKVTIRGTGVTLCGSWSAKYTHTCTQSRYTNKCSYSLESCPQRPETPRKPAYNRSEPAAHLVAERKPIKAISQAQVEAERLGAQAPFARRERVEERVWNPLRGGSPSNHAELADRT